MLSKNQEDGTEVFNLQRSGNHSHPDRSAIPPINQCYSSYLNDLSIRHSSYQTLLAYIIELLGTAFDMRDWVTNCYKFIEIWKGKMIISIQMHYRLK